MGLWVRSSIKRNMAISSREEEPYEFISDWRSIKRIVISVVLVVLWFVVMPVRQELNDGAARDSMKTEFNEITEEHRVRIENNLTREAIESRLKELREENQTIQEQVENQYEELKKSQEDGTNKGDDQP